MVWLTGGGLVVAICMIVGLLAFILAHGAVTLWPQPVVQVRLKSGTVLMGEVTRIETYRTPEGREARRRLFRTGNYELTNEHFTWVNDADVAEESRPEWALVFERMAWGRFYGTPVSMTVEGSVAAATPSAVWTEFREVHESVAERRERRERLETKDVGEVNRLIEEARLDIRRAEIEGGAGSAGHRAALAHVEEIQAETKAEFDRLRAEIAALNTHNAKFSMKVVTADGRHADLALSDIVRAYPANRLGRGDRWSLYVSRWREFLFDEPREANSEGGVFPAIFGTVVMTLIMSIAVVPFGVMAALYLREYAKAGPVVSAVRIAINNLAGVPSIVFGVFGLGFFCYVVGASIDDLLFAAKLPNPTYGKGGILWSALTLALMTLPVVIVATEEALAAVPGSMREGSFACGAGKWQTLRRIVMPRALPGIMTGMILAMARGAGEVAPLMLVGAVKLAPELPVDGIFPFIHPERSFMHLGFHIYDLGFQSQNSEAAKPMVFTTTLLLIVLIFVLNMLAVQLRTRLRRRFVSAVF
jgi:phosphate transport system permease protein